MPRPRGARDADYEAKRRALLRKMTQRITRREVARPSLRQLADSAGVSVPTLRHYFGDRTEVVEAMLDEYRRQGEERLKWVATPQGGFATSVRQFCYSMIAGMTAPMAVRLGDVFAVGLAEGLLDPGIGPAALRHIVDPAVDACQARLQAHIDRGEMIATDTRAAALMLLSPLLVAVLHQDQMQGASCNPVDLYGLADTLSEAFVRAYGVAVPEASLQSG
ncbi:MAG TPA: TetR/AcrR family transcriptional regulator [Phenylobacterium sp.]